MGQDLYWIISRKKTEKEMKFSTEACLVLSVIFFVELLYSLFDQNVIIEMFSFKISIWFYRFYRLAILVLFLKLYFVKRKTKNRLNN